MPFPLIAFAALAIDPAAPADPHPLQPLGAWFADSDYPVAAIRREASGTVFIRVQVGADGAPINCAVVQPVDPDLDEATCRIMMSRARFSPARDRRGRAAAGTFAGRIRWVLPAETGSAAKVRFAPFVVRVTFALSRGQRVSNCTVASEGNPESHWAANPCSSLNPGFLGAAGLDAEAHGQITILLRLEANRAALSADSAPGRLVSRTRVRFTVSGDGSIAGCEIDEQIGGQVAIPLCSGFPPGPSPFEAASAPAAPRQGRLGISFYLAD